MKNKLIIGFCAIVLLAGGVLAYLRLGGTLEVRRDRHLNRGREYAKAGQINESIIEFRNALKSDMRSADARYELALALLRQGGYRPAYQELLKATDLKPDFLAAQYQLGTLFLLDRNLRGAKDQLEKIRRRNASSKEGHYLAAQIAVAEKRTESALKELEAALQAESQKAAVFVNIGQIHMIRNDYRSAELSLRKALEVDPKFSPARIALARLYTATGNQKKAEQELIIATQN